MLRAFGRGPVAEGAMRPLGIVNMPQRPHDPARGAEAEESVIVEAFVARPPVKSRAVRVLDWLAGIDEAQRRVVLVRPLLQHALSARSTRRRSKSLDQVSGATSPPAAEPYC
jgi:hypothetical protein